MIQTIYNNLILTILFVCFVSPLSYSQFYGRTSYKFEDESNIEELRVMTDRDIYIAGETVLFKIYKMNNLTGTPYNLSKVVYLELIDKFNTPVMQFKIAVDGFSGSGEIRLSDTLRTGNYLIRSSTEWMQNFSCDLFSYKRISVLNPFKNIGDTKMSFLSRQPDRIIFYPEGGSLIAGLETVVGLRCFDKNGIPTGISGVVIDCNNDTLCKVKTDCSGYGLFRVRPSDTGGINLVTGNTDKTERSFILPQVLNSGIGFSVITDKAGEYFKIRIQGNSIFPDDGRDLTLTYINNSGFSLKKELKMKADTIVLIKKDTLPYGLAKLTIFDENGFSIADRWIFNEAQEHVNYRITVQSPLYSTRRKVVVEISASDSDGNPVNSDLTVSVVKSFLLDDSNCGNRSGYIQLPVLATMNTDNEHFEINNYLICFPGGDEILKPKLNRTYPVKLPEPGGHILSGRITDKKTGEPVIDENIVLSFVGEKALCRFSRTDKAGRFYFVINEYGIKELVIQPLYAEPKEYKIELDNPFPDEFCSYNPFPYYPDSSKIEDINNAVISMQIKNIYKYIQRATFNSQGSPERDFYGDPSDIIQVTRFIELSSVQEIFKEIIPGVSIYNNKEKTGFKIVNYKVFRPFENDPLLLVDGVPIRNPEDVLAIDPGEIMRIEILRERYMISDIIFDGIIHFITKKSNLSSLDFEKLVFRQEFNALKPVTRFCSPDYNVDSHKAGRIPDFRNTLYWNTDIEVDDNGKATCEFYTSDESGEYTITVEGIDSDGITGRSELTFTVTDLFN